MPSEDNHILPNGQAKFIGRNLGRYDKKDNYIYIECDNYEKQF